MHDVRRRIGKLVASWHVARRAIAVNPEQVLVSTAVKIACHSMSSQLVREASASVGICWI